MTAPRSSRAYTSTIPRRRCSWVRPPPALPSRPPLPQRADTRAAADLSKVQDDEVGDGTTSVAVLAGELLREAELLINQKLHPMTIIQGFRTACEVSLEVLDERKFDNASDTEALRTDLMNIATTTLSSKILMVDKPHFAKMAVDAVMCLKGRTNLEPIHVIKKAGGTLKESFLAEARRQRPPPRASHTGTCALARFRGRNCLARCRGSF